MSDAVSVQSRPFRRIRRALSLAYTPEESNTGRIDRP